MKKRKLLAIILVLALGAGIFMSCAVTPPDDDPFGPDIPIPSEKLAVPANLAADADMQTLSWSTVPNARGYFVDIDGQLFPVNENSYSLAALTEPKSYYIRVMAAAGSVSNFFNSDWSEPVTYQIEGDSEIITDYPPLEPIEGLTVTFRDEFLGNRLDTSKWEFMVAKDTNPDNPWGNHELQYYQKESATVSDGTLKITAKKEETTFTVDRREPLLDEEGNQVISEETGRPVQVTVEREYTMDYTSSRIRTRAREDEDGNPIGFGQKYGRFEAKIKLPDAVGMWPAFWMMPEKNVYGGWPQSGEIDIMEAKGRLPDRVGHALHFRQGQSYNRFIARDYNFPKDEQVNPEGGIDGFHIYRVDWHEDRMEWYVDGNLSFAILIDTSKRAEYIEKMGVSPNIVSNESWNLSGPAQVAGNNRNAPFDQEFHMLLNLAVGGDYDGGRTPPEDFLEGVMEVDYVRVWQFDKYLNTNDE